MSTRDETAVFRLALVLAHDEVAALREELRDIESAHRETMTEPCPGDDRVHCACVPALRREIARLREELEAAKQHEEQTHAELSAILGPDDSLAACARRAIQRAETAERDRYTWQGRAMRFDAERQALAKEARERGAILLAYCEHVDGSLTSGPLGKFSGRQWTRLYAMLSRAREEEVDRCNGFDIGDGNFSGCNASHGDCPECGK